MSNLPQPSLLARVRAAGHRLLGASGAPSASAALGDVAAGLIGALLPLTNCLSYAALIFSGDLRVGLPFGLWAFIAGAAIASLALAPASTIGPMMGGPRNPPIAVLSVLAAGVGAHVLALGGTAAAAVSHILVTLSLATLLTGIAMLLIGKLGIGGALRFVPAPVIAGFLGASGWFLAVGGLRVALGRPIEVTGLWHGVTAPEAFRVGVAFVSVALVHGLNWWRRAPMTLPAVFVALTLVLGIVLSPTGSQAGWYIDLAQGTTGWSPLMHPEYASLDWRLIGASGIEIASVAGVAAIGLLLDVSMLEGQRDRVADMDREFRRNGLLNLVAAPLGGAVSGLAPNASRLLDQLGGVSRLSGLTAGLVLGALALSGLDITRFVPTPVLGGLLLFLGLGVMSDAIQQARSQGSRIDVALALAIALAIVKFGYLAGIVLGLMAATLTFAVRYSMIGVIRRHATRAAVAAPVERAPEIAALLSREGRRIHVFWLSGYIFFGSSNRVLEEIQATVGDGADGRPRWVILDLAGVSGIDATAMLSFRKLARWAESHSVHLALSGMPDGVRHRFEGLGRVGIGHVFDSRPHALAWAEEALIAVDTPKGGANPLTAFNDWLEREVGRDHSDRLVTRYLSQRWLAPGEAVCTEGEIADTIDLVAEGVLAITVVDRDRRSLTLRRMTGCTVIGEMGFVRGADRSASVVSETRTRLYTLTRQRYDAMRRDDPHLAAAFLEFLARQLSDRLEFATREIRALS